MSHRVFRTWAVQLTLGAVVASLSWHVHAQGQPGQARPLAASPAWAADLDGYWVSVITENWRLRMLTPPKGDYTGIPIAQAGVDAANAWDPVKDEKEGQQCRSYGAAAIMMNPETLHITWRDKESLVMQIDSGMQTRVMNFAAPAPESIEPSWQGNSAARWVPRVAKGSAGPMGGGANNAQYLQVTTTHMLPGYLRRNGVPYSANAKLTEDYDLMRWEDGELWLVVTTTVEDPQYLQYPLVLSAVFKKQPDGSGWDPSPCSANW